MNRRKFLQGVLLAPVVVKLGLPVAKAQTEAPDKGSTLSSDGYLSSKYLFTDLTLPKNSELVEGEEMAYVFFVPEGAGEDASPYYVGAVAPAGTLRQIATPPYPFSVVIDNLKHSKTRIKLRTWTYGSATTTDSSDDEYDIVVRVEGDELELIV
ncbi:MAG: hypothetical protein DRQ43_09745 [Gammaproteobacteria bacterium]|nr:MAG: hypothetical protein DRQ43_09745 [Gammaproteobacteria bacterium]